MSKTVIVDNDNLIDLEVVLGLDGRSLYIEQGLQSVVVSPGASSSLIGLIDRFENGKQLVDPPRFVVEQMGKMFVVVDTESNEFVTGLSCRPVIGVEWYTDKINARLFCTTQGAQTVADSLNEKE